MSSNLVHKSLKCVLEEHPAASGEKIPAIFACVNATDVALHSYIKHVKKITHGFYSSDRSANCVDFSLSLSL